MAYAVVVVSEKKLEKSSNLFQRISGWFSAFFPEPVHVTFREIDDGMFLYVVTMPPPEIYYAKNRTGRKLTLKKWMTAARKNNIEYYLLEPPLGEYMEGGWTLSGGGYLEKSLKRNVYLLFYMAPLKDIKMQTMSIALSGVKKEFVRPKLLSLLSNFKLVNVIGSCEFEDIWDEFMSETGVPVCITEDFAVLSRSNVWISYEENEVGYPFNGIKISVSAKSIVYPEYNRKYRICYAFAGKMLKKLGITLIRRFDNNLLSEFLMNMVVNKKELEPAEAEDFLGVKFSILSDELLNMYS